MSKRIRITPDQVRTVASQFKQASDQSQEMVNRLTGSLRSMESEWEGMTKERFYGGFQEWQSHMTRFVSLLAEINTAMNAIADRFQAADEA